MKISCIMGPYMPLPTILGGAVEKIFLALCGEFARRGHHVTMISRKYDGCPTAKSGTASIISALPRAIGRQTWSSIICMTSFTPPARRRALPASDITITNSNSLPLLLPKDKAGKIYVDVARYPKGLWGLYRRVDRLQACSTHIARAICAQSPSVAHLVKPIPNAFTGAFAQRAEQEPTDRVRAKEIIFVGRIAREKGIELLIKAFTQLSPRYPDWQLTVVGPHLASQGGDGEALLTELKALAGPAASAIDFVGPIFDEEALADRYSKAAIFVYPSIAERGEAFPLAPLEAMACGCAPVVSDLRCFDDAITPEVNGLAFDHRDSSGAPLAAALERLMASDALRLEIAAAAKRTSKAYTPERVADLFLDDFAGLTGLPA